MSPFLKLGAVIVVLSNILTGSDGLNSADFICPCGCRITDTGGNIITLTNKCGQGKAIFLDKISFDCPCGCEGHLPNGYRYVIYPSKTKCAIQSEVKVLNSPFQQCQCGCKEQNISKVTNFTISVDKKYVLQNNVVCFNKSQPMITFPPFVTLFPPLLPPPIMPPISNQEPNSMLQELNNLNKNINQLKPPNPPLQTNNLIPNSIPLQTNNLIPNLVPPLPANNLFSNLVPPLPANNLTPNNVPTLQNNNLTPQANNNNVKTHLDVSLLGALAG